MTLDELLKAAGDHARERLITDGATGITPHYMMVKANGDMAVVISPWRDDKDKRRQMHAAGIAALKFDAVAACFVSEAWMVEAKNSTWHRDQLAKRMMEVAPSDNPDRIEVVQAIAMDGETTQARMWQIVRTRPGDESAPVMFLAEKAYGAFAAGDEGEYRGPGIETLQRSLTLMRRMREVPALQAALEKMRASGKIDELFAPGVGIQSLDEWAKGSAADDK